MREWPWLTQPQEIYYSLGREARASVESGATLADGPPSRLRAAADGLEDWWLAGWSDNTRWIARPPDVAA